MTMTESENGSVVMIEQEKIEMKKSISLFHCVSLMCAVTGHASVFIAPTAILTYTGSIGLSIILWIFGGLLNLCLALCYTEMGLMFPKSGGPYIYVLDTFGQFWAFMVMWLYMALIAVPFWAYCAYTASLYIIQPFYIGCLPQDYVVKVLAIWILVTFVGINCIYVKFVAKVQTILTFSKLMALLLIIVCGAISLAQDGSENLSDLWEGTESRPFVIAMAAFFSTFTYGGWQVVTNLIEEVKDPGRDLPLAVYWTFIIIIIEFTLVNLAYYVVLTKTEILNSATIALIFFDKFYPGLKAVISVLVAVTAIGALNCSILGHSRVLFAASRHNQAPVMFSMISTKFFTPWPAIFVISLYSVVMLLSGGVFTMIELVSLASILLSFAVVTNLLYLRWKKPNEKRLYKTVLALPISQFILLVIIFFLCVYNEPYKIGRGMAIIAIGIPLYILGCKWKNKPNIYNIFMKNITLKVQKSLLVQKSA